MKNYIVASVAVLSLSLSAVSLASQYYKITITNTTSKQLHVIGRPYAYVKILHHKIDGALSAGKSASETIKVDNEGSGATMGFALSQSSSSDDVFANCAASFSDAQGMNMSCTPVKSPSPYSVTPDNSTVAPSKSKAAPAPYVLTIGMPVSQ